MTAVGSTISDRFESRKQAKRAAKIAVQAWLDRAVESVSALADELGVVGSGRVAVFTADISWADRADDEDRESLLDVTFVGPGARATATASSVSMAVWAETVEVWHELREALAVSYVTPVPAAMIVDFDGKYIALYEPMYCPDMDDSDPVAWFDLTPDVSYDELDPFEALLASAAGDAEMEAKADGWERELEVLLDRYQLTPPTKAAHGEGDCELHMFDDTDDLD